MPAVETFAFQAEINQLLSLIINTFYSNKDVFLRELISNASDAIDKIRYTSLTNSEVLGDEKALEIKVIADKTNNTLTIWDTGIGMTREDLIKNLGTIAHSGTKAFMEALQAGNNDLSLIGQFGVGFYSSYLVAKGVKVITKHNDDKQYIWSSNACGTFTIEEDTEDRGLTRGTMIILDMKEDQTQYLEESSIRDIVKKHSQFCSFPIKLYTEREEDVPQEKSNEDVTNDVAEEIDADAVETHKDDDETVTDEVLKEDKETATEENADKTKEPQKRIVKEWLQLNTQAPIWLRKPEDVEESEYNSFYKSLASDWEEPLAYKHFNVDGQVQFKALLYIPRRAPFDMFTNSNNKKRDNIKLYVKKVLITDNSEDILPEYLSFVKGVVDSDDLPLNVSREMLQQNSILKVIKNNLIKKSIDLLIEIANSEDEKNKERWKTFYQNFHKNIKLGVHEDSKNRKKLLELVRYNSTKTGDDLTSLKDYVSRMKDGQKKIYYITGESLKVLQQSPFIQNLKKRDIEVLFMFDPIDEYMVQAAREYDDKELVCCSKDGLEIELTDDEKKQQEELEKEWETTCNKIRIILDSRVTAVKLSHRLDDTPCILVTDKYGWSANMERIMKAQALRGAEMMSVMTSRKILEINPNHMIMKSLKDKVTASFEKANIKNIVEMLYDTVVLDSGFSLEEPSNYAKRIYRLISLGMNGDDDVEEEVVHTDTINEDNQEAPSTSMEDLD